MADELRTRRMLLTRPHHRLGLMLLAGGVLTSAVFWRIAMPPVGASTPLSIAPLASNVAPMPIVALPEPTVDPLAPLVETTPPPSVIGIWEDDFFGKRRMTFRDDGTATMVIELDAIGQLLYGPRLTFFIEWEQTDNRLTMKKTGGEPRDATASVSKLFGETSEQTIESLTDDEMRLRSSDSGKLYVHRRVTSDSP
ncbi:MAG TPA: lipocalin family protein [Planctomycetaceae bacterium]|nr:lipocalin family protein [Planctomycetaceae bacterium]